MVDHTDGRLDLEIEADEHKLGQVSRNMLSNALKFTPKCGSVTVGIHLLSPTSNPEQFEDCLVPAKARGVFRMTVQDTGPGISKVTSLP